MKIIKRLYLRLISSLAYHIAQQTEVVRLETLKQDALKSAEENRIREMKRWIEYNRNYILAKRVAANWYGETLPTDEDIYNKYKASWIVPVNSPNSPEYSKYVDRLKIFNDLSKGSN